MRGEARLISSAMRSWVKIGPLRKRKLRWPEVGRELDALVGEAEGSAHRFDQAGLGKARCPDQQRMAAGEHRRERQLDHLLLPEDRPADFGLHLGECLGGRVGFRNDGFGS